MQEFIAIDFETANPKRVRGRIGTGIDILIDMIKRTGYLHYYATKSQN